MSAKKLNTSEQFALYAFAIACVAGGYVVGQDNGSKTPGHSILEKVAHVLDVVKPSEASATPQPR